MVDTTNLSLKNLQTLSGHKERVWSIHWYPIDPVVILLESFLGILLEIFLQAVVVIKPSKFGERINMAFMNARYIII